MWYPLSGLTYGQYMQANAFVKDISSQVRTSRRKIERSISDQTKTLVASQKELSQEFGRGFDSISGTLDWGLDRIQSDLQGVNFTLESIQADFDYGMGLLLQQIQIQSQLFTQLLGQLDSIRSTLESPTLTQAREFYRIGCERLSKSLLDKALESFLEAEKRNDTDLFTQLQIGKLYLYGLDDDDDVIDVRRAQHHLLLAARYAKAEAATDAKFAQLAAESLLHASIAIFAQCDRHLDRDPTRQLLLEAKRLACEAMHIDPRLSEAIYHSAKYSALLSEAQSAIPLLKTVVKQHRNYAVKVDIDPAFDSIRSQVLELLSNLKDDARAKCEAVLGTAKATLSEVSSWHLEESARLESSLSEGESKISEAQDRIRTATYFSYLDALEQLNEGISILSKAIEFRRAALQGRIQKLEKLATQQRQNLAVTGRKHASKTFEQVSLKLDQILAAECTEDHGVWSSRIELLQGVIQALDQISALVSVIALAARITDEASEHAPQAFKAANAKLHEAITIFSDGSKSADLLQLERLADTARDAVKRSEYLISKRKNEISEINRSNELASVSAEKKTKACVPIAIIAFLISGASGCLSCAVKTMGMNRDTVDISEGIATSVISLIVAVFCLIVRATAGRRKPLPSKY